MTATKPDVFAYISQLEQQNGLPPNSYRSLVKNESAFNPNAKSPVGAIGYSQLMPQTAKSLGVNPYDPYDNLAGGAKYFGQQLKTFGGNLPLAYAAYNAGPGAVQKYGTVPPYKETQNYVARNMADLGGNYSMNPNNMSYGPGGGAGGANLATQSGIAPDLDKQLKSAQSLSLVGSIINGIGQLANSVNQVYQATQGRAAIPIGNPLSAIGAGVDSFGQAKQKTAGTKIAYNTVNNIPGLTNDERSLLSASVATGDTGAGIKGAFNALNARNKEQLDLVMTRGYWNDGRPVTPEERKNWMDGKTASATTINLGEKSRIQTLQDRLTFLDKAIDDPKNAMLTEATNPGQISAFKVERDQIRKDLGVYPTTNPPQKEPGQWNKDYPTKNNLRKPPPATNGEGSYPVMDSQPTGAAYKATGTDGKIYYLDGDKKIIGQAK